MSWPDGLELGIGLGGLGTGSVTVSTNFLNSQKCIVDDKV